MRRSWRVLAVLLALAALMAACGGGDDKDAGSSDKTEAKPPTFPAGSAMDAIQKKGNTAIKNDDDLNGKKLCSAQGSTSINILQAKAPQADTSITFDVYSKCAEALGDGRVQAVTTDNVILGGLVADSQGKYDLVNSPFTDEPYGIGLKKGANDLRAFLNDRLEAIYKDGSWKKAFESTASAGGLETPQPPPVNRY